MNEAFIRYEELRRSQRVLSTSADNTLLDLLNSSYPTQPHSLIAKYLFKPVHCKPPLCKVDEDNYNLNFL